MITHTPGRWQVYDDGTALFIISAGKPREADCIAALDTAGRKHAHLIAAAPDCLRVLKLLANCQNYCMEGGKLSYELQAVLTEAENVIATATDCTVRRLPK